MKQCFGYVRVSTLKQGDGVSLSAQREAIENFASREGLAISAWYEEKETAAKSGRPVFNAVVKALKAGQADGLIMHRIDRSARNLKDWAIIGDLSDAGIDVHFATETLDFRSRGGRLTADIQAVIAADYIRNLSIEARKGINGRLKQGFYPWPAPLGYQDNGGGKVKTLDPLRAPLVRELFDRYLTGNYSIRTLHTKMVERGLASRNNRPVSKHTVELILQNPFYCGLMRNGRTGELFPGQHEPLITPSQFKRIADLKAGRYTKKTTRHDHLFRRLFTCEVCQGPLTPERQKSYVYYRCHNGCMAHTAREDQLQVSVYRALKKLELAQQDQVAADQRATKWNAHQGFHEERRSLALRIADAEARLSRISDLYIDEEIDPATYMQKRNQVTMQIATLKEEKQKLSNQVATEQDRQEFLERMNNVAALYKLLKKPEKRELVELCFSRRTWNGKYAYLEPSELLLQARDSEAVPIGGAIRDTIRAFIAIFNKRASAEGSDRMLDIEK